MDKYLLVHVLLRMGFNVLVLLCDALVDGCSDFQVL